VTLAARKVISHLSPLDMKIQTNTHSIKRSRSGQNGKKKKHSSWMVKLVKITLKRDINVMLLD